MMFGEGEHFRDGLALQKFQVCGSLEELKREIVTAWQQLSQAFLD